MSGAEMAPEIADLYRASAKEPLVAEELRQGGPLFDQEGVCARIPHRGPFLLVSRVQGIDAELGAIAATYDLEKAREVLAGHFPAQPVWPGVLQVEAVGQVGLILHQELAEDEAPETVALTHVLRARFLRPIEPGCDVEILARIFEDGLFVTIVGQCLQDGRICSVAAVSAL